MKESLWPYSFPCERSIEEDFTGIVCRIITCFILVLLIVSYLSNIYPYRMDYVDFLSALLL